MANKPCILFDVHVFLIIEPTTFNDVSKLDVCPELAVSANSDIVIQV